MSNPPLSETSLKSPPAAKWILVVDDEPSMRALIEAVLQAKGWTVQTVDGSEEALAASSAAARPPSLVICDVHMQRIDGPELARRMCAQIPGLKVIFISGHISDISWWPDDMRNQRFLAKPFDNADLVAAVGDALADTSIPD
jgi:DNA-binding NtrC family response regulator